MSEFNDKIVIFLKSQGADIVGFADLSGIDAEARDGFPAAICIGIALDPKVISDIKIGPTSAYHAEYKRVNILLDELAQKAVLLLMQKGYKVKMRAATFEEDKAHLTAKLPHKTVATRAGVGWIGKSALLVTREYGPAVRFVTVLTDAPVSPGTPIDQSLCSHCLHCVNACPAHALTGKEWVPGNPREVLFDAIKCRDMALNLSSKLIGEAISICGLCIAACPWTQRYIKRATGSE